MDQTRRTLAEALTPSVPPPELVAIIKEGTPKPQTQVATLSDVKVERKTVEEIAPRKVQQKFTVDTVSAPEIEATMQIAFRVPAKIPAALLKASTDRKTKRILPCTQQAIATEALSAWLRKHSYLE